MESTNLSVSDTHVDTILKYMKSAKSPEPGNINLALIKYGERNVLMQVTQLLNKISQGDSIPQEMKMGYLIQIHMKGENRKCKKCR
jgi:hypothetical protein